MEHSNRIMLPSYWRGREYQLKDGRKGYQVDLSFLIYLAEEIVASSAIGMAISSQDTLVTNSLHLLPSAVRTRVDVIDVKKSATKTQALLQPIMEEVGLEVDLYARSAHSTASDDLTESIRIKALALYSEMLLFLSGIEHKLTIDFHLVYIKKTANELRAHLRNPKSRANLAIIEGILNTYKDMSVKSIQIPVSSATELVDQFEKFVSDETYMHLTRTAVDIGIPEKLDRAKESIARLVRKVLRKPWAKAVCSYSSKAMTASTGVPTPDSEIFESIVDSGYLPPVTSMKKIVDSATNNWKDGKLPAVHPDNCDWGECSPTGKYIY